VPAEDDQDTHISRGSGAQESVGPPGDSRTEAQPHPAWLKRVLNFFDSTTKVLWAAGGLIAAAVALWATISHLVVPPPKPKPTGSGSAAPTQFIVAPESCGALIFGADGAAGPVTCPDGRPNIAADRYYRHLHLRVLDLGSSASPGQVFTAICADQAAGNTTFVIERDAVELAEAEQDWHFGVNPVDEIGPVMCPSGSPSAGT